MDSNQFQAGLTMLQNPILPLARLVQLLFITGPFSSISELLAELNEPIETNSCRYDEPQALLRPYMDVLNEFHRLKKAEPLPYKIIHPDNNPVDPMEAVDLWTSQAILTRELETLNSLLCAPCRCTLCCVGPDQSYSQSFFEIPLSGKETALFSLPSVDTPESRGLTAHSETVLKVEGKPFFASDPAIYNWQNGWSMILPKETSCQKLRNNGRCTIYPERPDVCKRPQIFSYVLEASTAPGHSQVYIAQSKVLAIWDCPYVKQFKDEIAAYAELCEIEPIFKENKN
nr:hypothetical protein [Desulfobulbaceae bacterium]